MVAASISSTVAPPYSKVSPRGRAKLASDMVSSDLGQAVSRYQE
jgi:hypothetical protein